MATTTTELIQPDRLRSSSAAGPATAYAVMLGLLVVAAVASVLIGSRLISPTAILEAGPDRTVVEIRAVRTAMGVLAGVALGLAGACMQGLTRNPLADPGILGVNAGAALAIVLGIAHLGAGGMAAYVVLGLVGAAVASLAVHAIAGIGRDGATPAKLTVAGAAFAAAASSWTVAVQLVDQTALDVMRRWQVGSIGGRPWDLVASLAPVFLVGTVLALALSRTLNALALGEEMATGLGRHTTRDRVFVGIAIALLAGTATAAAGPIAFVGLIVPHLVRTRTGSDHRHLLPLSAGYGAVLVLVADTVGRVVLPPSEVQVGIMTAVVGVPFFLLLVRRGRMGL
ncbi:iron ABC transporter permease [Nocardioides flavus (ex Wang et al. 2016)]|uniref:Iron ABC transporter permease n=1 Tax=Nocardioides flavus (ex Wang et al. 2016) TaxID=2058780 RepID=A0ABQ3HG64_9ACTN|nr:iron ABC transporter permease [Nocardioides flavus (ex Wang et al. 2016)]GHE15262.1 iron ABC transporter permease [Nocardioides flavus (ex Wang et al. 2016)]